MQGLNKNLNPVSLEEFTITLICHCPIHWGCGCDCRGSNPTASAHAHDLEFGAYESTQVHQF